MPHFSQKIYRQGLVRCIWRATPGNIVLIGAVIHQQQNTHKLPKSILRAVLGRMQFTLHETRGTPHGTSRLVQAMPAGLVKTRRAPSRHSRHARVYCHTTTAMHKLSTPLPPLRRTCCVTPGLSYDYERREKKRAKLIDGNDSMNIKIMSVDRTTKNECK